MSTLTVTSPSSRGGTLVRLALLLVTFLLAGCGSSNGYVFSPQPVPGSNSGSGSLTFNFVRAQAPLTVPQSTSKLRFEFWTGQDGTGERTRPDFLSDFAAQVTVVDVPTTTRSVVVTASTAKGAPLLQASLNVTVVAGGNVVVDFGSARIRPITATSLELSPDGANAEVGALVPYSATVAYSNGDSVINPEGVVFSASGAATVDSVTGDASAGSSAGTAAITATLGELSDTVTLTVTGGAVLSSLTLSPENSSVAVGSQVQFTVSGRDTNGNTIIPAGVTWSSSAPAQTTIDGASGLAVGVAVGSSTISARVGNVTGSTTLTVTSASPVLNSLTVSPDNASVGVGSSITFTANGRDQNGNAIVLPPGSIVWSSSAPAQASIDAGSGVASGVAPGSTTITARVGSISASAALTVVNSAPPNTPPVVTLDPSSVGAFKITSTASGFPFSQATVTDNQPNLAGGTLTISSSLNATPTVAILTAPATPAIGVVSQNATSRVIVALDAGATPAAIENFLRGVTASTASIAFAEGSFSVSLSDGASSPLTGNGSRPVLLNDFFLLTIDASGSVRRFDTNGTVVGPAVLATLGVVDLGFSAFDSLGNLYVPRSNGTVAKMLPDGTFSQFVDLSTIFLEACAFQSDGTLLVSNFNDARIDKVTPAGAATNFFSIAFPIGIALDTSNNIYVGLNLSGEVWAFKPDGTPLSTYGVNGVASTGVNSSTRGLAFDSSGNLYVGHEDGRIVKINPTGTTVTPFGSDIGQCRQIAFDSSDNLYAADSESGRIVKITSGGAETTFATGLGNVRGLVMRP